MSKRGPWFPPPHIKQTLGAWLIAGTGVIIQDDSIDCGVNNARSLYGA
jgi:hypothetical protein